MQPAATRMQPAALTSQPATMCNQARLIRLLTAEDEGEGGSYSTLPTVPASQGWHGRELARLALEAHRTRGGGWGWRAPMAQEEASARTLASGQSCGAEAFRP